MDAFLSEHGSESPGCPEHLSNMSENPILPPQQERAGITILLFVIELVRAG